jgi:hypothetical protein
VQNRFDLELHDKAFGKYCFDSSTDTSKPKGMLKNLKWNMFEIWVSPSSDYEEYCGLGYFAICNIPEGLSLCSDPAFPDEFYVHF